MKRFLIGASFAATVLFAGTAFANDEDKFRKMDSDGDSRISSAEYSAHAQQTFTMMDTNGDGAVTMEEMKMHKKMKKDGMHKDGMHHDGARKDGTDRESTARDAMGRDRGPGNDRDN
jgi:hypothetical protein